MRIEKSDGTVIDIPNWLIVILAFIAVGIIVPAIAILGPIILG